MKNLFAYLNGLALVGLILVSGPEAATEFPDQVRKPIDQAIEIRQKTQKKADNWAAAKAKLRAEYEQLEQTHALLSATNAELKQKVAAREAVVKKLEQEIEGSARMAREVFPFMERVYARLADLVQTDDPFLADERQRRIANLRRILDDHEVSLGEKFRKIFEALAIEAEYGATVEVYPQKITIGNTPTMVNIFRLGRMALFFQTPDGKTCGTFDSASREWRKLPPQYHSQISAAMEIGAKRRPVEMLNLPIGRVATQ